jgi:hypothetical protein
MRLVLPALVAAVALTAIACGRGPDDVAAAPATDTAVPVELALTPPDLQENRASGLRLGLAFSANLVGELEPCG